mmetsp:Transcript_31997/g.91833  ORF Transcript_31997/g.91833 Transcript_31997/m.91833 type:complete len:258 (-) Transcript_31997:359-1132(-)
MAYTFKPYVQTSHQPLQTFCFRHPHALPLRTSWVQRLQSCKPAQGSKLHLSPSLQCCRIDPLNPEVALPWGGRTQKQVHTQAGNCEAPLVATAMVRHRSPCLQGRAVCTPHILGPPQSSSVHGDLHRLPMELARLQRDLAQVDLCQLNHAPRENRQRRADGVQLQEPHVPAMSRMLVVHAAANEEPLHGSGAVHGVLHQHALAQHLAPEQSAVELPPPPSTVPWPNRHIVLHGISQRTLQSLPCKSCCILGPFAPSA